MEKIELKSHKPKPSRMTSIEETVQLARMQQQAALTTSALYDRKPNKKALKVLTVAAYILFVSMAAITLSLYYVVIWDPASAKVAPTKAAVLCDTKIIVPENIAIRLANATHITAEKFYKSLYQTYNDNSLEATATKPTIDPAVKTISARRMMIEPLPLARLASAASNVGAPNETGIVVTTLPRNVNENENASSSSSMSPEAIDRTASSTSESLIADIESNLELFVEEHAKSSGRRRHQQPKNRRIDGIGNGRDDDDDGGGDDDDDDEDDDDDDDDREQFEASGGLGGIDRTTVLFAPLNFTETFDDTIAAAEVPSNGL